MSDLSPEAQKWLEEARGAHSPEARDRDRVFASLSASLGIIVPAALTASTAQAASEMATSGVTERVVQTAAENVAEVASVAAKPTLGLGTKLLGAKLLGWKAGKIALAAVALGGVIGVGTMQRAPSSTEQDASRVRTSRASSRPAEEPATSGLAQPGEAQPAAAQPREVKPGVAEAPAPIVQHAPTVIADAEPTPPTAHAPSARHQDHEATSEGVRSTGERASRRGSHRTSTYRTRVHREVIAVAEPVQPEVRPEPVEEPPVAAPAPHELELIRKAMTSLRDHAPERALSLLDEHAGRYPNGAFSTERRGLHAVALCAAGRLAEGRSEQAAFLRTDGTSPIAQRVRRACKP